MEELDRLLQLVGKFLEEYASNNPKPQENQRR